MNYEDMLEQARVNSLRMIEQNKANERYVKQVQLSIAQTHKSLYDSYIEVGFTPEQAIQLTISTIGAKPNV